MQVTQLPKESAEERVHLLDDDKSGNAKIRHRDSRNKRSIAIETLLDGAAEAITRKLIEKALEGDAIALRLCCERLLAPRRDCPVAFDLPIKSAADAVGASSSVLAACAKGMLSPGEASAIMGLIATHARTLEVADLEARVSAIENEQEQKK
jgi:hypothetical protein